MGFRLTLPDEILGERAVLEDQGEKREVHAVPLEEGRLDPVLEEAVASQPKVAPAQEASSPKEQEASQPEPESEVKASGPSRRPAPLGYLAALGAGVLVLVGLALGMKGGTDGVPAPSTGAPAGPGVSGGPSTPDLY